MPIYLIIAKTTHTVKIMNMCCFGYDICVTVLLLFLVVLTIVTGQCLGFNKNVLSCLHRLLQLLLPCLTDKILI